MLRLFVAPWVRFVEGTGWMDAAITLRIVIVRHRRGYPGYTKVI